MHACFAFSPGLPALRCYKQVLGMTIELWTVILAARCIVVNALVAINEVTLAG